DIAVVLWNLFYYHISPPADMEAWARDGIPSWLHTLFWAPHHLVSMLCCMLAFLLASMNSQNSSLDAKPNARLNSKQQHSRPILTATFIALALASAFGLSIYVPFAFFLAMLVWAA